MTLENLNSEGLEEILRVMKHGLAGTFFEFCEYLPLEPFLVDEGVLDELAGASGRLLSLLTTAGHRAISAPSAFAHADSRAMRSLLQDEEWERLTGSCMARPDVLLTEGGIQFLEYNISSTIGGLAVHEVLAECWRELYGEDRWRIENPLPELARFVKRVADRYSLTRVTVAQDTFPGTRASGPLRNAAVRHMRELGLTVELLDLRQLSSRLAELNEYDLVILRNGTRSWEKSGLFPAQLSEATARGVRMISGTSSYWATLKTTMATLSSEPAWLSPEDREFVRKYVPWTRSLVDGVDVVLDGVEWNVRELLTQERGRFVLKSADGFAGGEVVSGQDSSIDSWSSSIQRAMSVPGSWVVQEYRQAMSISTSAISKNSSRIVKRNVEPVVGPLVIDGRAIGCKAKCNFGESNSSIVADFRYAMDSLVVGEARGASLGVVGV